MQIPIVYFCINKFTPTLNAKLHQLYNSLEFQRIQLLDSLKNLSSEKLNRQPKGKWSINQIVAHLITAERMSIQYLTKKIQGIDQVDDTRLIEELKMIALIVSQRLPLKFKAPRAVVENTPHSSDLRQLAQEWNTLRIDLKNLLEKIADHQIKRKIYKHVRAGKLNIQQALVFFREHIIHHRSQINHLLRA
jgi:uncharacterized damage-inducible protein DinB